MKILYIIITGLFIVKSCGNSDKPEPTIRPEIPSGTYDIIVSSNERVPLDKITIAFDTTENKVSGFSGCNNYLGLFSIEENNKINFGKIILTKRKCHTQAEEIQTEFLKALKKVKSYVLEDDVLMLNAETYIAIKAFKSMEKKPTIEYSAASRNTFKNIKVDGENIEIVLKRGAKPLVKACSEKNWNIVAKALGSIQLYCLPNLKVSGKKHQFDGAPLARLKITSNGKTFQTPAFDHGNPPSEISMLVNEILSLAENIE